MEQRLLQNESGIQDGDPFLVVRHSFAIGRMGDLSCHVSCGVVLIGDIDISAMVGNDAAEGLYSEPKSDYVTMFSSMNCLELILSTWTRNGIQPLRVVGTSDSGEWVEVGSSGLGTGSLRSAVWFRFLQRDGTASGQKDRWEFLAGE